MPFRSGESDIHSIRLITKSKGRRTHKRKQNDLCLPHNKSSMLTREKNVNKFNGKEVYAPFSPPWKASTVETWILVSRSREWIKPACPLSAHMSQRNDTHHVIHVCEVMFENKVRIINVHSAITPISRSGTPH